MTRSQPTLLALLVVVWSACESEPEAALCGHDVMSDREHCGRCDHACERDDMCLEGACVADRNWALWPVPPQPLPDSLYTVSDETVIDEVTGLEWQREVEEPIADQNAKEYCQELALAGGGDWRLPTRIELLTIVDHTVRLPATNTFAFPGTPNASFKHDFVYGVSFDGEQRHSDQIDFSEGAREFYDEDGRYEWGTSHYVRCVRGGAPPEPMGEHYEIDTDTVLDRQTGLRWQRELPACDSSAVCSEADALASYQEAVDYCADLELDGHEDFRVPSILELYTLVYPHAPETLVRVDRDAFPAEVNDLNGEVFSSTPYALSESPEEPWPWVLSGLGYATRYVGALRVRCVRDED